MVFSSELTRISADRLLFASSIACCVLRGLSTTSVPTMPSTGNPSDDIDISPGVVEFVIDG